MWLPDLVVLENAASDFRDEDEAEKALWRLFFVVLFNCAVLLLPAPDVDADADSASESDKEDDEDSDDPEDAEKDAEESYSEFESYSESE